MRLTSDQKEIVKAIKEKIVLAIGGDALTSSQKKQVEKKVSNFLDATEDFDEKDQRHTRRIKAIETLNTLVNSDGFSLEDVIPSVAIRELEETLYDMVPNSTDGSPSTLNKGTGGGKRVIKSTRGLGG